MIESFAERIAISIERLNDGKKSQRTGHEIRHYFCLHHVVDDSAHVAVRIDHPPFLADRAGDGIVCRAAQFVRGIPLQISNGMRCRIHSRLGCHSAHSGE